MPQQTADDAALDGLATREVRDQEGHERFVTMERRLLGITNIAAVLALGFGAALLVWWHAHAPDYLRQGWLHAKLALVVLLLVHFTVSGRWLKGLAKGKLLPSSRALRWFNEIPVLLLVGVVYLVLAKPF